MADGKNQARALRILEIANDFRTLQMHINSFVTRPTASPPNPESHSLDGYVLLRQCSAAAQHIIAIRYEAGSLGVQPGPVPATEVQKAALQRIILDVSTRRYQAHKIYLRAAAGIRWVQGRSTILQGQTPNGRHAEPLRALDQRLRLELAAITDQHVVNDLRAADLRKHYWVVEDPTLERMLAWARTQR